MTRPRLLLLRILVLQELGDLVPNLAVIISLSFGGKLRVQGLLS